MTIQDFRNLDRATPISSDVCVVGSGPAGWTIAEELRDSGLQILVLESGGADDEPELKMLNETEDVGVSLFNGRRRALGGTPEWKSWGNRCIAFDDIDYEARPWVPHSGWPFGNETISPYLDRASRYLSAGPYLSNKVRLRLPPRGGINRELDSSRLRIIWWHHGKGIKFARMFRQRLHPSIRVLVHATVVHLNTNASGSHIETVEISDPEGRRAIVRARAVVLCAGGIENARILLYSNRIIPSGVGNVHDLVGRFLMDHPRDLNMAVTIDPAEQDKIRDLFGPYMFDSGDGPRQFVGGLALSSEMQRREQLLNCAAWPSVEVSEEDPIGAALRLAKGERANLLRDLALVASDIGLVLRAVQSRLLRQQPIRRKYRKVGFVIGSEQCPDPNSRVTLSKRVDRLGLPIAKTDWRISHQDQQSQVVLAKTMEKEFRRLGLPKIHLAEWVTSSGVQASVMSDGCHPTGTTRMATDPRCGVVNADCRVHGVDGLYVAGSSVFPTAGHANPTMMIVAVAARLAEHLKTILSQPATAQLRVESDAQARASAERQLSASTFHE